MPCSVVYRRADGPDPLLRGGQFPVSFVMALLTPLVLSFSSAAVLGAVSSIGGCGMLAGSIVVDTWGGPRRRISGVCAFAALAAVAIVLVGVRPSAALIGAAAYVGFFCSPIINSLANVILPSKVAADVQGRVRRIEDELPGAVIAQAAA